MSEHPLFPLECENERLTRHARLPLHIGTARLLRQDCAESDDPFAKLARRIAEREKTSKLPDVTFDASLVVPATGEVLIFLQGGKGARLNRDFGDELTLEGEGSDGRFRLHCPRFYVKKANHSTDGSQTWGIATPVNETATLNYGDDRPISRVTAVINNFDFEQGNYQVETQSSGKGDVLRVEAEGHFIDFERRDGYESLKTLLDVGAIHSAALARFSFDAWEGASEGELEAFAHDIKGLCTVVARQHTGLPVLTFLDDRGRPVKRLLGNPVESNYRRNYILAGMHRDCALPKLFRQCFAEFRNLRNAALWQPLPAFCASVEDPPYLEQKCASLLSGLELLLRNSLIEAGTCTATEAAKKSLTQLVSAARSTLRWDIPSHYTAGDRVRLLRNAVSHGGDLPESPDSVRRILDKWSLFLMRRFLIRLGYDGKIASPNNGYSSTSLVNDFSESCNSF
jgi:hypothetical protein